MIHRKGDMVRHIVIWTFQEQAGGSDKRQNLDRARSLLLALKDTIPVIREWEVAITSGIPGATGDLVLQSTFDSFGGLAEYQSHPEHQRVVSFLRSVHSGKVVADYDIATAR
jgi:hypothetical protein